MAYKNGQNIVKRGLIINTNSDNSTEIENLHHFLIDEEIFHNEELTIMDCNKVDKFHPTKRNIIRQFDQFVTFAYANHNNQVQLFISYCGNGYPSDNIGEEVLCPIDYEISGYIYGDYFKKFLIDRLPKNTKIFVLIDSNHKKTFCNLKFKYEVDRYSTYTGYDCYKDSSCEFIMINGIVDNPDNSLLYAITRSFIKNFRDQITYQALIIKMREWLKEKNYNETLQLTSSRYIDIKSQFLISKHNSWVILF